MSKGEFALIGFGIGLFLAIGVDPVGIVIEVLKEVLTNFYVMVGSGIILAGLFVLLIYRILNKAEPAITAFRVYSEGGRLGLVTFFLGLLAGFTIIKVPPVGVFLLVIAALLEIVS